MGRRHLPLEKRLRNIIQTAVNDDMYIRFEYMADDLGLTHTDLIRRIIQAALDKHERVGRIGSGGPHTGGRE